MPELPEVETIKRGLEKRIVGKTITKIEVLNPKSFQGNITDVEGKKVKGVWRRAKMLGIDLECQSSAISHQPPEASLAFSGSSDKSKDLKAVSCELKTLLIHLKLTGQLIWIGEEKLIGGHPTEDMEGQMPNKSTVVIFEFEDNSKLFFNDQRKFGWVKIIQRSNIKNQKELVDLGPEPLEATFTWEILKENLFKHPKTPIKIALMDQSIISGVGNIYASESLYLARIDPRRKINTLSDEEIKKITAGIKESLEISLKYGGSTRQHYRNVEGEKGEYLSFANVYGREGQPCKDCSGKVKKITLGGRGTYYCHSCQK